MDTSKKVKKTKQDDRKNKITHELWVQFLKDRNNIQIKNKLIEYYYPMVRKMGSIMYGKMKGKIERESLISYAVDGLYKSIDTYTLDKGAKFQTFAYQRIFGSIIDTLRSQDWVPRSVKLRSVKVEQAKNNIRIRQNRQSTDIQAILQAGFQQKSLKQRRNKFFITHISSLESNNGLDSDIEEIDEAQNDYLASQQPSPFQNIFKSEFFENVVVKNLDKQQYNVIYMKYYEGRNNKNISDRLDILPNQISKIHNRAIKKLKTIAMTKSCAYLEKQTIEDLNKKF